MKSRIGSVLKTIICALLVVNLGGCWSRHELDTLGIVMGIGLDQPEASDKVKITAQIVKPGDIKSSKQAGGGGGAEAFWNVENTGNTVFSALSDLANRSSRKLFFPHNQVLIFGRSLAEKGIRKYIDFFARNPETRVNIFVLVAQGTAGELLNVKPELDNIPATNLAKLVQIEAAAASHTGAVRLREFVLPLMSKTTAPVAPLIEVCGAGEQKAPMIAGTAVFKSDKLIGELGKSEGRGLLWTLGKVKSAIIEVNGPNSHKVSLETIRAHSANEVGVRNKKLFVKVLIREEGNVGEQSGPENLSTRPAIALLEKRKAAVIRSEVMAAVKKAQQLKADVFGFGDAFHRKFPRQWKNWENKWNELFPEIEVKVKVEAKLRLMGKIVKPIAPAREKK